MSKDNDREHELGDKYSEGSQLLALEMERRGWNQSEVQREIGVASGVVGRWLHGEKRPGSVWASKIEEVFGVPASAWGRDPKKQTPRKRTGTTG